MTMLYHLSSAIVCLLSFVFALPRSAAGEEAEPAKRDIQFVLEDEPYVTEATGGDLHYAAIVRGFAMLLHASGTSTNPPDARGIYAIARLDRSPAGSRMRELVLTSTNPFALRLFRAKLIEGYEEQLTPSGGMRALFSMDLPNLLTLLEQQARRASSGKDAMHAWRYFVLAPDGARPPLQEYALLAPTAQEAKQFAEDFLHVYDRGFVPFLEKLMNEEKHILIKSRDAARAQLDDIDQKIAAAGRGSEAVEQLDDQSVSSLKVKRTLLKVELAGVHARLSLIESKIKEKETAVQTRDKLFDLKVSADIDLASLTAQKKVLDELLDGQSRLAEIHHLRKVRPRSTHQVKTAEEGLQRCEEVLADLKPFQLIDDTVVIRPLRFHSK